MRILTADSSLVNGSLNHEMSFYVQCEFESSSVFPIEIHGELKAADGIKIANTIHRLERRKLIELNQPTGQSKSIHYFTLIAPLQKNAIEHIQKVRENHHKKDVHLILEIFVKGIYKNTKHTKTPSGKKKILQTPNTNVLLMDFGQDLITINISASNWVHDYIQVFQKTKYLVLEIPQPQITVGDVFLKKKINAAIQAIPKMEKELIQGEWNEVVEKSRPIIELLREKEKEEFKELTDLLISSGFSKSAIKNFTASLNQLFHFASIFIHKIDDTGKKLNPEMIAYKEDAQLIYSLCCHIVHLITKKINKIS